MSIEDEIDQHCYSIGSYRHPVWLTVKEIREQAKNYYFDRRAANGKIKFIESHIRHMQGDLAKQLIKLEPWQKKAIRRIFGWKRKKDGYRVVRRVLFFLPKKNGKSLLTSGLGVMLLFLNKNGPAGLCCAWSKEQAEQVFKVAAFQVENDPLLSKLATKKGKLQVFRNKIKYPAVAGEFKVISSKAGTKHGENLSFLIIDEIHTFENSELYDVLMPAVSARSEPLTIILTTAGTEATELWIEEYDLAKSILKREKIDHKYMPIIFEAEQLEGEPEDFWHDPKVWKRANPNLGIGKKWDYMHSAFTEALGNKRKERKFKQLELNMRVSAHDLWFSDLEWYAAQKAIPLKALEGLPTIIGIDLSSNRDLTAISLMSAKDTGQVRKRLTAEGYEEEFQVYNFLIKPYFWIPEQALDPEYSWRSQEKLEKLQRYVDGGYIQLCPGAKNDYDLILDFILQELVPHLDIQELAFDKYQALYFSTRCEKLGFTVAEVAQNYTQMNSAIKWFEGLILGNEAFHDGDPVLDWNRKSTTIIEDKRGNKFPCKATSKDKIDGAVATLIAAARMEAWLEEPNVYETQDLEMM